MRSRCRILSDSEFEHVLNTVMTDMHRLEILTHNRVKFLTLAFDDEYEWPLARVTVDDEEEKIWYDFTAPDTSYWCEEMDISGSVVELAKSLI